MTEHIIRWPVGMSAAIKEVTYKGEDYARYLKRRSLYDLIMCLGIWAETGNVQEIDTISWIDWQEEKGSLVGEWTTLVKTQEEEA